MDVCPHRFGLASSSASPPPPTGAIVIGANADPDPGTIVHWLWDRGVNNPGGLNVPQLEISQDGGISWVAPNGTFGDGSPDLFNQYSSILVTSGDIWRIVTATPNLSPAAAVPQSGIIQP